MVSPHHQCSMPHCSLQAMGEFRCRKHTAHLTPWQLPHAHHQAALPSLPINKELQFGSKLPLLHPRASQRSAKSRCFWNSTHLLWAKTKPQTTKNQRNNTNPKQGCDCSTAAAWHSTALELCSAHLQHRMLRHPHVHAAASFLQPSRLGHASQFRKQVENRSCTSFSPLIQLLKSAQINCAF